MPSLNKALKVLLLLLVIWFVYSEFFATRIKIINNTDYDIYSVKGEYYSKSIEPSSEEIDRQQRLVIAPKSEKRYTIRFGTQITKLPMNISLGWATRIYDDKGNAISVIESRGSSFVFSKEGFCNYEIIIHQHYAQARGLNKHFCYRRILLDSAKNIMLIE